MRSNNIKTKVGRGRPKRLREVEISGEIDENQNPKKNRIEILDESVDKLKLFEERFKEAIKTGIDLFHDRISLSAISLKERLAYMIILKKIMTTIEWKFKRLVSTKQQMECLTRKAIESPKERKNMLTIMEKFVEYKLKSFPGKTRHFKAESIAKHYQCELKCYGVTQEILSTKIDELVKTIEVTEGPISRIEKNPKNIIKILKVKNNVCRLCGSKKNLIYSINQRKENIRFKEVVEYFCRVNIRDNDNLPHLVCKGCKDYIENFSKFSEQVNNFQNKLDSDAENYVVPKEFIKTETVYLDYEEDTNSGNRSTVDFIDGSSHECTEYSVNEIEVGVNYICCNDNLVTINSPSLCETRNEIPIIEPDIIQNTPVNEAAQDNDDYEMSHVISCSEVSTSTPKSTSTKQCKIVLERLPIKYVPSDSEESQEELEEVNTTNSPHVRSVSSLEIDFQTIQSAVSDLIELKLEILKDNLAADSSYESSY
ncbi:hypothetical protein ACKWTF_000825 [Chironomus riparius]